MDIFAAGRSRTSMCSATYIHPVLKAAPTVLSCFVGAVFCTWMYLRRNKSSGQTIWTPEHSEGARRVSCRDAANQPHGCARAISREFRALYRWLRVVLFEVVRDFVPRRLRSHIYMISLRARRVAFERAHAQIENIRLLVQGDHNVGTAFRTEDPFMRSGRGVLTGIAFAGDVPKLIT